MKPATEVSSQLPEFPRVPRIRGRILVGGKIHDSGFETRQVLSQCGLPDTSEVGQDVSVLGTTPNVNSSQFMEAVESASTAWAKGLGDWPTARMEDRIAAVAKLQVRMLEQRELVCRLLMWEIGKTWIDSQTEFDRTIQY